MLSSINQSCITTIKEGWDKSSLLLVQERKINMYLYIWDEFVIHMNLIRISDEQAKTSVDDFCVGFKFKNDKHPLGDGFKKQIKSIEKLMTCWKERKGVGIKSA